MDSITHTVLGACMGEAIAGKRMGKKAMLWGALANNFPDVDVVSKFWTTPAGSLLAHRGITHSIIASAFFSFLFAYLFNRRKKYPEMNLRLWLILFGTNIFTHLFIDAFTTYGTGWFEPFSHARVSFNTMFILDPLFMLPVLITSLVLLILKRGHSRRLLLARLGLALSGAYALMTWVDKACVNRIVKENIAAQGVPCEEYMAAPTALNNFLWYIVAKGNTEHYIGYYSLFDRQKIISFYKIQKQDSLLDPFDPEEIAKLRRFAKGYYRVSRDADTTVFSDMRFGQMGGWDDRAPFVFRFDLSKGADNATKLQQGRFKAAGGEEIRKLWMRIKGI